MKKKYLLAAILFSLQPTAHAADLLQVYQQALSSDPLYQQAISQRLATREGVPISLSSLLPNINVNVNPSLTRAGYSGATTRGPNGQGFFPPNNTNRAYNLQLSATQTIFNFAQFTALAGSLATAKGADATLNAALQDLMVRVSTAYFNVLQDEEELSYSLASKRAYAEQLNQIKQQYKVGLKTVTELYTAQSSYDSASANYIATQTKLSNDRENLRVITGKYYAQLSSLSNKFPLISPQPRNIEKWVEVTLQQNWQIKSGQYQVDAARQMIRQQFGGHLPTVSLEGSMAQQYNNDINGYGSLALPRGASTEGDRSVMLNIAVPIYSGGNVTAETNQATYQFQATQQQLEQTTRDQTNKARQSYLGILSGISQISADKAAIKSAMSSLDGMEANYQVGTETLVNVLNQQEKVFLKQTAYARDRYQFVKDILNLKQAAGTLSFDDLRAINAWLVDEAKPQSHIHAIKIKKHQTRKKSVAKKSAKKQRKIITKS